MLTSKSEWPALVVAEMDTENLVRDAATNKDLIQTLPVKRVRPLKCSVDQVAVLSYRWDSDGPRASPNIISAICQAERMGFEYLFVDQISIDQTASGEDIIRQVLDFAMLYKTIPVIVAYDTISSDPTSRFSFHAFWNTMRRPWIYYEAQLYTQNPTKVVYIGHSDQGAQYTGYYGEGPRSGAGSYIFGQVLLNIGDDGFASSIVSVLTGSIGMAVISDLQYMMPWYAQILRAAYRNMTRNDYLLTAAMLCQADCDRHQVPDDISHLDFTLYSLGDVRHVPWKSFSRNLWDIYLRRTKVAVWEHGHHRDVRDSHAYYLRVLPGADSVISAELGLEFSDDALEDMREAQCSDRRLNDDVIQTIEVFPSYLPEESGEESEEESE